MDIWLRSNRRVVIFGLLPVVGFLVMGGMLAIRSEAGSWLQVVGCLVSIPALFVAPMLLRQWFLPRVGFRDEWMLVYLRGSRPYEVPLEVVECFFLGHACAPVPTADGEENAKMTTVVVRLAEKAQEWHDRPVKSAFGSWREGYITMNGLWCEPLSRQLVNEMNARLHEVQAAAGIEVKENDTA